MNTENSSAYVVLLRGVNVGGANKLPMKDLCAMAAELGFDEVSSYIQSGNLLLRSDRGAEAVGVAVGDGIAERFGFRCAATVRSASQLAAVVAASPYAAIATDHTHLHVTFLIAPATGADAMASLAGLDLPSYAPETLQVVGEEVHLHLPNGIGRSRLATDLAKRKHAVNGTTRNWRTVSELADRLASMT